MNPYKKECDTLVAAVKKSKKDAAASRQKQRYAFYIMVRQETEVWSYFQKKMVPRKNWWYIKKQEFNSNMAYDYCLVNFTTDISEAQVFSVQEVVEVQRRLPFGTTIDWKADFRSWCADCKVPYTYDYDENKNWKNRCPKCKKESK